MIKYRKLPSAYKELPSFVALTTNMSALKSPESSKVSEAKDVGVLDFFWNSSVHDLGALKKINVCYGRNEAETLLAIC